MTQTATNATHRPRRRVTAPSPAQPVTERPQMTPEGEAALLTFYEECRKWGSIRREKRAAAANRDAQ